MLCIGAGWEVGGMVSQVVVFFACFLNKNKKECLWYYFIGAGLKFLFAKIGREKCETFVFN